MNISIERLEEIEQERELTMINPQFQKWMKELNISRSYYDPTPRHNAQQMMEDYNYTKWEKKLPV